VDLNFTNEVLATERWRYNYYLQREGTDTM